MSTNALIIGITYQVIKQHMQVEQEGEMPFESEFDPNVLLEAEVSMVTSAASVSAALSQKQEEDKNFNLILHQSVKNSDTSINSHLVCNIKLFQGNLDMSDLSELEVLGNEVENDDPLPKNLPQICASCY